MPDVSQSSLNDNQRRHLLLSCQYIDKLPDLIAAIDRRISQVERVGETEIAREAVALRIKALKRIDERRAETGRQ